MANPALIPKLTAMLSGYPSSSSVANAYASSALAQNLVEYFGGLLSYPFYSGDLLVGEAPGHRGCARTGIPLTSEFIIAKDPHPFIASLRPRLFCSGIQTESTATMVWSRLALGSKLPAFWNTFPFHPHDPGKPLGNRTPNAAETRFGIDALDLVLKILAPRRVFALGRTADSILAKHFSHVSAPYIRHPANGGYQEFVQGITTYQIV